ncbi:protein of unknown function [Pararobbsia alpina]
MDNGCVTQAKPDRRKSRPVTGIPFVNFARLVENFFALTISYLFEIKF